MPPKSDLWKHVDIISEKDKSGNVDMECKYCHHHYSGNAARILYHLVGSAAGSRVLACTMCEPALKEECLEKIKKSTEDKQQKSRVCTLGKSHSTSDIDLNEEVVSLESVPKKAKQGDIKSMLSKKSKHEVDSAVARFFYGTGCSFNRSNSPYFDEMLAAVARYGPGYKKPHIHALRQSLLVEETSAVKQQLATSVLDCLGDTGATLASDGWSSVENCPLLNSMLVTPKGASFQKSIDTSGVTKDASYIADVLTGAIKDVGPENIVQVVMDGAAACLAAGRIIEARFPHITFTHCTAHVLDLLLEDICKLSWAKSIRDEAMSIVHFLTNHHMSQAFFRQQSKEHSNNLQLKKPRLNTQILHSETRFAYLFTTIERLIEVCLALERLMVNEEYRAWSEQPQYDDKAEKICELIQSRRFWKSLTEFSSICMPIVLLLRLIDSNQAIADKVYHHFYALIEHVKSMELDDAKKQEILPLIEARWNQAHSPIHAAGYALDPEYRKHDYTSNEEVMEGFELMLSKVLTETKSATASLQHSRFKQEEGMLGSANAKVNAMRMPAWKWWLQYGSSVPELQKVAVKVLSQCSSACSCERNWSSYSFIHSKECNRLKPTRAQDLVYVFSNLRLLQQVDDEDYEEAFPLWDSDSE